MKRDLELIRKIVLAIEDGPTGWAVYPTFEGYSEAQVRYHAYLLMDAGYAKGIDITTRDSEAPEAALSYLTWAGHEFADQARDETRWKTAISFVKTHAGSVSVAVLTQYLSALAKQALGLP